MTPREIVAVLTARTVRVWACVDGSIWYRPGRLVPDDLRVLGRAAYTELYDHLTRQPQVMGFGRGTNVWHIAAVLGGDTSWALCGQTPLTGTELSADLPPFSPRDRLCSACIRCWVQRQLRSDLELAHRSSEATPDAPPRKASP